MYNSLPTPSLLVEKELGQEHQQKHTCRMQLDSAFDEWS